MSHKWLAWAIVVASLFMPLAGFAQDDPVPVLTIGEVQGAIPDDMDNANLHESPYLNERVQVSGIITNTMVINTSGRFVYGFFLQETPAMADGDPTTSDAIFVVSGRNLTLGDYPVVVGDEITVTGQVEEFYGFTRLRQPEFVSFAQHHENVADLITPIELNPLGDPATIYRDYERVESMWTLVPAGAVVVAPAHLFSSTNDTEVYVVRGDHPIIEREDVFAGRVFRDVHVLDDGQDPENLYRISVEANVLKSYQETYDFNLPAYNTFDVFTAPVTGHIVYAFNRYTLQIDVLPTIETPVLPADNDVPPVADRATQFTVATLNVENLYDYYNDPFDREDTPNNPRLNYVPLSIEEYQTKVNKLALQILMMGAPDIIGLQEIEDQDVCVDGGQIYGVCNEATDNADGQPDVVQDVAREIARLSNDEVIYLAAIDRDSADERGISQAFLYRADRVELVAADETHPVFGARPDDPDTRYPLNQEVSNPKSLNKQFGIGIDMFDRPPLVGHFRIYRTAIGDADFVEVYYLVNHFKSNPEENRALHEGQSTYNLGLMADIQAADPNAYVILGGDLNSFPESSEMQLLDAELVNVSERFPAASDYTYIFAGQAQTLDYLFITPNMDALLADAYVLHYNADYAYTYDNLANTHYRAADHDPIVAYFNFPSVISE